MNSVHRYLKLYLKISSVLVLIQNLLLVDLDPVLIPARPLAHGDDDVIGREPAGSVQDVRRNRVRMRHRRLQSEQDSVLVVTKNSRLGGSHRSVENPCCKIIKNCEGYSKYELNAVKNKCQPQPLFHLFSSFLSTVQKNSVARGIQTRIIVVVGK